MNAVRISRDADRDLDEIWLYIARDNVDAATRLIEEITASVSLIASCPEMGRKRDELRPELRSHPVGNYVVYYRIGRDFIGILRIVHGSRDPKRVFRR
jgi:toxin ParE1/3/4